MSYITHVAFGNRLVVVTGCFALGIIIGQQHPLPEYWWHLWATALFMALSLCFLFPAIRRYSLTSRGALLCFTALFSFLLGILHISTALQPPDSPTHLYNIITQDTQKKEAVIVGTMLTMPSSNNATSATTLECAWIRFPGDSHFSSATGKIRLRVRGQWPLGMPGESLIVRADLKRPKSYKSPGAFDYIRYLAEKGIWVTGFIRSPLFIETIEREKTQKWSIRIWAERLRAHTDHFLRKTLPPKTAGLYRAILLGDRAGITPETIEAFKASGALHLLAISGLHLTVIWGLLYYCWYWLLSRSEFLLLHIPVHITAALCALPFLAFYALLAGLQTPVMRALIMSTAIVLAIVCRRRTSPAPLLACAALLLLLLQPTQLFTPSFQLSFIAVATIFFLLPLLRKIFQPAPAVQETSPWRKVLRLIFYRCQKILTAGLALSAGIALLTAPISIYHFSRISWVGAFANLLLEPLLCLWALPCGILALFFLFLGGDSTAAFLLQTGAFGLQGAEWLVEQTASLPFAFRWVATPAPWFAGAALLFYTGLALLAVCQEKIAGAPASVYKQPRRRLGLLGGALLACSIPLFFYRPPPQGRIAFLDVGQGSATVIQFADGHTALIDGGGSSFTTTSVGQRVIAPYLWQRGIDKVDTILITHPDADHINGLNFIISHFHPDKLVVRAARETHHGQKLLEFAQKKGCTLLTPAAGETLFETNKAEKIIGLHNFGAPVSPRGKEKNRGLVFLVEMQKLRCLFPGDIDKEAENRLVTQKRIISSGILLAAHHGSKTSSSKRFINEVNPEVVIVSAGDREGIFPSLELVKRMRDEERKLLTTARHGTIEVEFDEKKHPVFFHYAKRNKNPLQPYERKRVR